MPIRFIRRSLNIVLEATLCLIQSEAYTSHPRKYDPQLGHVTLAFLETIIPRPFVDTSNFRFSYSGGGKSLASASEMQAQHYGTVVHITIRVIPDNALDNGLSSP